MPVIEALIYVACPLLCLFFAAPVVAMVLPVPWPSWLPSLEVPMAVPVLLGVVAAPGYHFMLFRGHKCGALPAQARLLTRASVSSGVLATLISLPFFVFLAWPLLVLPLTTLVLCLNLLLLTFGRGRAPALWGVVPP